MDNKLINDYILLLEQFKRLDGISGYINFFNKVKTLDEKMMKKIFSALPRDDLDILQRLCTVETINKFIFSLGDEEQRQIANEINIDGVTRMYKAIKQAIIANRIRQAEEEFGYDIYNVGQLSPEFVDYLNSIEPRELPDGEDDQGPFTFRMDAPKVLRAYRTLSERLGRALAESLMFHAREYQEALERIRAERYAAMEAQTQGYGHVRGRG